ncbi:integrase catalytic domain-containing protein [Trichonephila clavipes]|uniref:Integrase catalytic domain-containing protein n=1 Tax=Trichonephila clavipes TaxID=2585209 RepID=A0A8X6WBP7_TRICX|nr:integrase catalytic domain-containing protein [Trichonephila clavipes]
MDLRLCTYGPVAEAVRSALKGLNAESTPEDIVPVLRIMWDRKGDTLYVESLGVTAGIDGVKWYERFSQFSKMTRILGWVKRFTKNCLKNVVNQELFLSVDEVKDSRGTLLLLIQALHCCLIRNYHLRYSHAGIQALTVIIREEFWIIGARRTIRSVVKQCVRCKRFSAKPLTTAHIQLPLDRVRDAFAFTGVDLCGLLILKSKNKSWVVLFTCAVYRHVHPELITSISTECFIHRFIARRDRLSIVYSDNETNFVGASAGLEKVVSQETLNPITWKFISPTAAWWERLVRSVKNLIVRVLGQASVNYEELLTTLYVTLKP